MSRICCVIPVVLWLAQAGLAGEKTAPRASFAVYPVTTALQRTLLGWIGDDGCELKAYVSVDGAAVMTGASLINERALNLDALRNALGPHVDRDHGALILSVCFKNEPDRNPNAEELLVRGLEGFATRDIGFKTARAGTFVSNAPNFDWSKMIDTAKRKDENPERTDAAEAVLDSEFVNVYPVQTELTRLLTGNADCVVDILAPPGEGDESILKPVIRKVIIRLVGQAKLREKQKLAFLIKGGLSKLQEAGARDRYLRELSGLANDLGFAGSSVTAR